MHFTLFRLRSNQVQVQLGKTRHHLYDVCFHIHDQARTRTEVFYAVQGKRIHRRDKTRVDSLANMLQRCLRTLRENAREARALAVQRQIHDRDVKHILRFQKEVETWTETILKLQSKLQRQNEAEKYFQQQADETRKLKDDEEMRDRMVDYLNTKPLPPLRKSVVSFTTGIKSRVTILPAEKDVEIWLMLDDQELNPIINSSRRSRMAFEQDGFLSTPRTNQPWI